MMRPDWSGREETSTWKIYEWQSTFLSAHKWVLLELIDGLPENSRIF
jgi:hypothetical protein